MGSIYFLAAPSSPSGEDVPPEQFFTVSTYPRFLHSTTLSHPHSLTLLPSHTLPNTTEAQKQQQTQTQGTADLAPKRHIIFTPVDSNKPAYVTPDIFGVQPGLGKAVASSTPLPRTLPFTHKPSNVSKDSNMEVNSVPYDQAGSVGMQRIGGEGGGEGGGRAVGRLSFGSVRAVLNFGSGRQVDGKSGEVAPGFGTQLTPRFGKKLFLCKYMYIFIDLTVCVRGLIN